MNRILYAVCAMLVFVNQAIAAVAEPEPPPAPAAKCDLTFASGAEGKGYSNILKNIKQVCPDLPVCDKPSEGGLQNLTLLSTREADVALVQVDTLMHMQGSDDQLKQLQVVATLHYNLLHIVTRAGGFDVAGTKEVKKFGVYKTTEPTVDHIDIVKFSDLKGKTVAVVGSAQLLVRKLNDASGHGMQFVDYASDAEAVKAMNSGSGIFAVMSMAAWPHGFLKGQKQDSGLKLVPYDLVPTEPYAKVKKNYANLGQYGVEFLSASNVIVTRPFLAGGQNAKNVAAIKACILAHLGELKDGKFEPGWGEVTNIEESFRLPKFAMPKGAVSKAGKKK